MRFDSTRQAWYDAFDGSAAAFDYEAMGNGQWAMGVPLPQTPGEDGN
ncbi:hypothetical protein [Microbulbifer variabilis]|nr:hypothetical protein [Microbulbifer variabilis]